MNIDWSKVNNFWKGEFSEDPDKYADPQLIYDIDLMREKLGVSIYPSKASGALARFSGSESSRHYAVDRKSDALDFFVDKSKSIVECLLLFLSYCKFGGIGVYFDTTNNEDEEHIMFHLDRRPLGEGHSRDSVLIWYRDNGEYYYPLYSQFEEFLKKLK